MNQTYFTEKIETLPLDVQEAIRYSDWEKTLASIQREYKLHIDQGQILETLTAQLMFGDIDAAEFVNNMFNEAHVSSSVAGDILLKIDLEILKKIRMYIENLEERRKEDEELERLLMSDAEIARDEESTIYANYYANVANILQEEEEKMLEEGILPDGSNITDEMLAEAMGISIEEFKRKTNPGALREAYEYKQAQTITPDLNAEKTELLQELENPQQSFERPLFTKKIPLVETPIILTPPDHQLQNTHIETPYVEEIQTPTPPVTETLIKKPTKIVLTTDPYKEPIE